MARGERNRARVRLVGLDEHAPRRVAAAAPGELGDQLERALLSAEVRQRHAGVRVDDGCKRNALEVMSLGHHLRPEEDRAVGLGEGGQPLRELSGVGGDVRIEADEL